MKARRLLPVLIALSSLTACAQQPAPPLWGFAIEGEPRSAPALAALAEQTRMPVQLVSFFQQWPEDASKRGFPIESLRAIREAGAVPVISWEPMYYQADGKEVMVPLARILGGDYDGYIDDYAKQAAAWPGPVIVRLAHEMNLARYHWGTDPAGFGENSPAIYQQLWRHIVGRFRAAGADNVLFAFCPNSESVPAATGANRWNTLTAYYPGHEWVDLLGLDGYNWGDTQTPEKHGWRSHWRSFAEVFREGRETLRAVAPDKPLIIFETSSAQTGGDKTRWLREAVATATEWRLGAVIWFQVDKEIDWRFQSGIPATLAAELRGPLSPAEATVGAWKKAR
ncbi:MAG TPA: glycosyl hydrolase [Opitutaceae bacterium]